MPRIDMPRVDPSITRRSGNSMSGANPGITWRLCDSMRVSDPKSLFSNRALISQFQQPNPTEPPEIKQNPKQMSEITNQAQWEGAYLPRKKPYSNPPSLQDWKKGQTCRAKPTQIKLHFTRPTLYQQPPINWVHCKNDRPQKLIDHLQPSNRVERDAWQKKERKMIWRHGMNNAQNTWKTRKNGPNSPDKHCSNTQ